jgi:hypothetical protein
VLQPNITEVNIYNEPLGAWVLGKVFLSQVIHLKAALKLQKRGGES